MSRQRTDTTVQRAVPFPFQLLFEGSTFVLELLVLLARGVGALLEFRRPFLDLTEASLRGMVLLLTGQYRTGDRVHGDVGGHVLFVDLLACRRRSPE